jgi:hypothetical protein
MKFRSSIPHLFAVPLAKSRPCLPFATQASPACMEYLGGGQEIIAHKARLVHSGCNSAMTIGAKVPEYQGSATQTAKGQRFDEFGCAIQVTNSLRARWNSTAMGARIWRICIYAAWRWRNW